MRITSELLKRYGAEDNEIESFIKIFPSGAEYEEIIQKYELSPEMLHFIRKFFSLNEEELKKYFELCRVENSERVWDSTNILNSKDVSNSVDVKDSLYVRDSDTVENSSDIYSSINIINSNNVLGSENINDGYKVISSTNISTSEEIFNCDAIYWSKNIAFSTNIEDSEYLYVSRDSRNCFLSGFLNGCDNCLLCYGLRGVSNYIFNQEVTYAEFQKWKEKIMFYLYKENCKLIRLDYIYHNTNRFSVDTKVTSIFKDLSKDFFGHLGTIPYYNESIFLDLFFLRN